MKMSLWMVGTTDRDLVTRAEDYHRRLQRYTTFEWQMFPAYRGPKVPDDVAMRWEAQAIVKRWQSGDMWIILHDKGKSFPSEGFARQIEDWQQQSVRHVVFLIGGAYGLDASVLDKAAMRWSLSEMIFSHQIIRIMALEQIYRAFTIIKGEPYHHA